MKKSQLSKSKISLHYIYTEEVSYKNYYARVKSLTYISHYRNQSCLALWLAMIILMYKKTVLSVIINIYYHIILSKYSIETSHRISHLLIRPLKEYDEDLSEEDVASCFCSATMNKKDEYCYQYHIHYRFIAHLFGLNIVLIMNSI